MYGILNEKKIETHGISGGKKIDVQPIFSFKFAAHVFCEPKIGRKPRIHQNILQNKLQAEL